MPADEETTTFEGMLKEHLELIDLELHVEEVPLWRRPMQASIKFVIESVEEIRGDTKEGFATKPWFAIIYQQVEQWYRTNYGAAFEKSGSSNRVANGTVIVRHMPVRVAVPLTRTTIETPGETVWLHFPNCVVKGEDPWNWLLDPPNLTTLGSSQRSRVLRRISGIATAYRQIRTNTIGVDGPSEVGALLNGVLGELNTSAECILSGSESNRGAAMWALQMAVERTAKALILQRTNKMPDETHNLSTLYDATIPQGESRKLLGKIPVAREMIDGRYGLGPMWTQQYMAEAHFAALQIIADLSGKLGRKMSIGGGRFLLKRPPWRTLPEA